ncbi:hypothetical protein PISMIDRAFT_689446 [Pisolithus microcarpus 441]|uniref:Uncharacterized protein n=1 Tax=Pisolithus microcarpus 441 TaxID=765257 RepID=A0A0C9YQ49_9AGAM|nr:hypothetical protein PISMIDRAFT_689446 [Pisolithus microcarpus 441]
MKHVSSCIITHVIDGETKEVEVEVEGTRRSNVYFFLQERRLVASNNSIDRCNSEQAFSLYSGFFLQSEVLRA